MRLLVGARIYQALNSIRRATTPPVSYSPVATTHVPKLSIKTADTVAAPAASTRQQQLQQLWELSKATPRELAVSVTSLSERNDFDAIEKLLESDVQYSLQDGKVPSERLFIEVLRAAVLAKSLGSLSPSIVNWMEEAARRLPEPIPVVKSSIIWLLSILRGDLPMLQQLQQESNSEDGKIVPEILSRDNTLRQAALTYLEAGNKEEFRSLWKASGKSVLNGIDLHEEYQSSALLHHVLLRSADVRKPDPTMLRLYAELLVENQRTAIHEYPQFVHMMVPVISALGGRIEKWREFGARGAEWKFGEQPTRASPRELRKRKLLRKWRDDYDGAELDKLVHSMINYMKHCATNLATHVRMCTMKDVHRLERMLVRLNNEYMTRSPVVIDWNNFTTVMSKAFNLQTLSDVLPSHKLIVVGRENGRTVPLPRENSRVKVMEVAAIEEKQSKRVNETDEVCAMILAVASRGHLLSRDRMRNYISDFADYLKLESRDVSQANLLKNYLTDATLTHDIAKIQPPVDYTRAAQWIDEEKKELAFTVDWRPLHHVNHDDSFRLMHNYSLHID